MQSTHCGDSAIISIDRGWGECNRVKYWIDHVLSEWGRLFVIQGIKRLAWNQLGSYIEICMLGASSA